MVIKHIFLTAIILGIAISSKALCAEINYNQLFPSETNKSQYEIGQITFIGNINFNEDFLKNTIYSKVSIHSFPYSLFQFTYNNTKEHPLVPAFVKRNLDKNLQTFQADLRYFSEDAANIDLSNIRQIYSQSGFHDLKVHYRFITNYTKRVNELIFFIDEGIQYKLNTIDFEISDSLPIELSNNIQQMITVESGHYFNEFKIITIANQIIYYLKNNGYYFATYSRPQVIINNETHTDNVSVQIVPGPRCKIRDIQYEETLNNQKALAASFTSKQLEFSKGDWYSTQDITKSESNFLSLNTFQFVKIDTTAYNQADSSLDIVINLKYKKQKEYGFSAFTNRTMFDKYWNAGVEFSYTHKNAFGAAQVFNPFARIVVLDISRAIYDFSKTETEYQIGVNLSQPILWTINKARIGILSQIMYSKRTIYDELKLSTFSFPVKFPISLPKWTFFNMGSVEFSFERQVPDNYPTAIENALENAPSALDTVNVYKKFLQFSGLYGFVQKENPLLTSTMIGMNIIGDNRNDPFSPNSGHYTVINFDISPFAVNAITGLSNFAKIQFLHTSFHKLNSQAVLALKFRAGHIFWFDKAQSIVPYERQFFAGGANSIRGWSSRRLRYFGTTQKEQIQDEYYSFIQDYIGSTSLIEGSIEWRYKLVPPGNRSAFQQVLQNLGVAFFLDFGNAYQWFFYQDENDYSYKPKLIDYLKGIALAGGVGFRYDTPVGVVRLDFGWKLYDPNSQIDPELFPATSKFTDFQFHIGLGNPF